MAYEAVGTSLTLDAWWFDVSSRTRRDAVETLHAELRDDPHGRATTREDLGDEAYKCVAALEGHGLNVAYAIVDSVSQFIITRVVDLYTGRTYAAGQAPQQ